MLPLSDNFQLGQKGESLILPLTNLTQTESVRQQKFLLEYKIIIIIIIIITDCRETELSNTNRLSEFCSESSISSLCLMVNRHILRGLTCSFTDMFLYCRECVSRFQCDNDSKAVQEIFRNSEIQTSLLQKTYDSMQQSFITKTALSAARNNNFVYKILE